MANPEHVAILKQGVEVWNRWREENSDVVPDLIGLDFSGLEISEVNFSRVNFAEANFGKARLFGVNLANANLTGTNFSKANLIKTNLQGSKLWGAKFNNASLKCSDLRDTNFWMTEINEANLSEATLSSANFNETSFVRTDFFRANFHGTNLIETDLSEADLREAKLGRTILTAVKLSQTLNLETVIHRGPSYIDTYTLIKSRGQLPQEFLRGCGLSDWEIEVAKLYDPSLSSAETMDILYQIHRLRNSGGVQYNSCFISYASQDGSFARQFYNDLQNGGVRCWFAPEDMKIGDKIRPVIDQSIRIHDKLLLILSENSLNSFWVESEIEKAFEEERQRRQIVLFPVRLDEAVMDTDQPWAAEIRRTRHIGDFTRWKDHDSYQAAFERLLRDLKAEG